MVGVPGRPTRRTPRPPTAWTASKACSLGPQPLAQPRHSSGSCARAPPLGDRRRRCLALAARVRAARVATQPLVRINGRWVKVRPEDVQAAIKFMGRDTGGTMKMGEALRMAYASDLKQTGIPVVGLKPRAGWNHCWAATGRPSSNCSKHPKPSSARSVPTRPAACPGWSSSNASACACLADDMGLGKTISCSRAPGPRMRRSRPRTPKKSAASAIRCLACFRPSSLSPCPSSETGSTRPADSART